MQKPQGNNQNNVPKWERWPHLKTPGILRDFPPSQMRKTLKILRDAPRFTKRKKQNSPRLVNIVSFPNFEVPTIFPQRKF